MTLLELFTHEMKDKYPTGELEVVVRDAENLKVYDNSSNSTAFIRVSCIDALKKYDLNFFFNYDSLRKQVYMHVY